MGMKEFEEREKVVMWNGFDGCMHGRRYRNDEQGQDGV